MYNSLVILLNRPFVSDGHLQCTSQTIATTAFAACVTAAQEINKILLLYRGHFCMKRPPYFISYATYVSATIHARIAAQQRPGSEAHRRLQNCLFALAEQQVGCHGPRRMLRIVKSLLRYLGVRVEEVPEVSGASCSGGGRPEDQIRVEVSAAPGPDWVSEQPAVGVDPAFTELHMDKIMRSFDFRTGHLLSPPHSQGTGSASEHIHTPAWRMGPEITEPPVAMDNLAPYAGDGFEFALQDQELFSLDPLFGFDGLLFPDNDV